MSNWDTLLEEGKEYLKQEKYHLAKAKFEKIIGGVPGYAEAHFELGKAYYMQRKYQQAIRELEATKRINSQHIHAPLLALKIYKNLGQLDRALEEVRNLLPGPLYRAEVQKELNDICPAYLDEISYYNSQGKYEIARKKGRNISGLIPGNALVLRNKLLNELEIAQKKYILDSKLRNIMVTLSTRCNLDCVMCEQRGVSWEIPPKTIEEIVSLFPFLERIIWQGGEALLLDYFGDLIQEAGRFPHLKQVLTSNGLLIDEEWAEKLIGSNVNLTLSIDGVSKEVYERIRRKGSFEVLMQNLVNFNSLKKEHTSSLRMHLNVVVMESNYHQLERFIDFAEEYEFNLLTFLPLGGNLACQENIFHPKNKKALSTIRKVIPRIEEKGRRYGIIVENQLPISIPPKDSSSKFPPKKNTFQSRPRGMLCHLPWVQLFIDYQGGIRPDCHCFPGERVGQVTKDSLSAVWNNEGMQLYRKKIATGGYSKLCNPVCIKGCIPQRYLKFR